MDKCFALEPTELPVTRDYKVEKDDTMDNLVALK